MTTPSTEEPHYEHSIDTKSLPTWCRECDEIVHVLTDSGLDALIAAKTTEAQIKGAKDFRQRLNDATYGIDPYNILNEAVIVERKYAEELQTLSEKEKGSE